MVDRQDIDALLVGSLYGELTPAEEARLAAHLESHPTDRSALEDLKHARAAVRESRIFDQQDEPPQAISALLLQEAHRRAPKAARVRSDEEREGWFARITRSFFAHPAMAAAAMLVLVLGVAGTVYMKKGASDQFAATTAPQVAQEMTAGAAPTGGAAEAEKNGAPGAAAGSAYAVELAGDQTATRDEGQQQGAVAAAAPADDKAPATGSLAKNDSAGKDMISDGVVASDRRQATAHSAGPAPKKKYAELRTEDPQPMDLDSPTPTKQRAKGGPVNGFADLEGDNARGASGGGGGAAGGTGTATGFGATVGRAPSTQAQPQAPAAAPAPPPPPPSAPKSASVATAKPTPSSAPPAAQAPAQNKLEAQPQTDALLGWAQGQLAQAISFARKDQCSDAAKIAMTIHDRAPAFYSQNVADNRELKGCAQYLRAHAEQAEEKAKRAAPAKANNADNAK